MTLLLHASEVADLIDPLEAIEITADVVPEEAEATTIHIPQFGGASTWAQVGSDFIGGTAIR